MPSGFGRFISGNDVCCPILRTRVQIPKCMWKAGQCPWLCLQPSIVVEWGQRPEDHYWPSRPPSRFNVKPYVKEPWQKVIEQNTLSFAYALFCLNTLHAQILHTLTNSQKTHSHPCDQSSPPGQCLFPLKL